MSTLFYHNPSSSILKHHHSHLKTHTPLKRSSFYINSLLPTQSTTPQQVQTFWQWLSDEKVVTHKSPAKPGVVAEGLGLVAQKDISRNEVVLEIPKKFWINPDTVAASEIGNVCSGLKPWVCVALFLIKEKLRDDESWWYKYIDILPQFTDSTIFWWVCWLLFDLFLFVFPDIEV